jgi:hypothetical protein
LDTVCGGVYTANDVQKIYFGNPELSIMMMVQNNIENKKFNFRLGVKYFCILHTNYRNFEKDRAKFLGEINGKKYNNIASNSDLYTLEKN